MRVFSVINKYCFSTYIDSFRGNAVPLRYFGIVVILFFMAACSDGDPGGGVAEAKLLYQGGEYQAAIIELKKILQKHPDNAEARFVLGKVYLETGNGKSAVKELALAKKHGFSDQRMAVLLAEAYLLNGEYDRALKAVTVSDDFPDDLKIEVMLLHVAALFGKGEAGKAEKLLSAAAVLDKNNVDLLLAQSRYALTQKNYQEVKKYLAVLNDIDPGNIDGSILRGMLHLQQREYEGASKVFEKVIAKESGKRFGQHEFSARVGNIQSLLALGKADKAEKNIRDFLSRSPGHPVGLYFEAVVNYDKKNYSGVKDNLQQVLSAIPNHYPSFLLLGAANYAEENYEQANKFLTKFVNRVPTDLEARKLLGMTRLRLNRSEEALDIFKKGEADADAELLSLIGRVAMRTDARSAVDYFERASEQKPESTELRRQLAQAYIASGKLDKAVEELNFVGGESALQAETLKVFSSLRKGDFVKARGLAEKLVNEHAMDARFYMVRASVEISAGDKPAAEEYLKKAIEIKNDYTMAMTTLAKLKIQSGDLDVAKEWFDRVARLQPDNLSVNLGLAEIAERQGFPETAIKILQKASENHPDEYVPQAVLAGYYLQKGKAKDARDLLVSAVKNNDHAYLWQLLGQSYEALKNWEEARNSYEKVISLMPKSADAHVSLAKVFTIVGNHKNAEDHLDTALKISPGFAPARAGLASLAISDADYKKADMIGRKLTVDFPDSPPGFLVLANSALGQKKYQDARRQFVRAFDLGASRRVLLRAYADFQAEGQEKIAAGLLAEWLEKSPADNAVRLMLATKYQESGSGAAAEKQYRLLLKESPENAVVLNNLALLRSSENLAEAKILAAKAYENGGTNVAIMDTYGWILVQNGEYQRGQKILEDAVRANPYPDIQYHLAFVLAKTGKAQRAKSILSEILASSPVFAERVAAEQLMKSL